MPSDPPKKRSGGSKKFQDASDELRLHMAIRQKATRMSEMLDRHEQVGSAMRELLSSLLVDLDKQGEKFMNRVDDAALPSTPPPVDVEVVVDEPRPSVKPTAFALPAMNARTFERTIRDQYSKAKNEAQKTMVIDSLRNGLANTPGYASDEKLRQLEGELRRQ